MALKGKHVNEEEMSRPAKRLRNEEQEPTNLQGDGETHGKQVETNARPEDAQDEDEDMLPAETDEVTQPADLYLDTVRCQASRFVNPA